ncbi:MAG: ShlB/FhaC/HecB family hemolysin secretion/activation protein [Cyanobacteria bacterium J06621_15]
MYSKFTGTCFYKLAFKLILGSSFLAALPVIAQTSPVPSTGNEPNPNIDRFPQPLPTPKPLPPDDTPIIPTPPTSAPQPEDSTIQIPVRKIEVTGSTILSQEEIAAITKTVEGRSVTLQELRGVVDKITQVYLSRGYITSRAVLTDQTINDGVVRVIIVEGSLEKIEVNGTRRLNKSYIRSRIRLGVDRPLQAGKIEEQLRLLRLDSLLKDVEATLKPGTKLGQSILSITVEEANAISGFIGVDNYSPPAVGSERLGSVISFRNPIGIGDELSASYYRSTAGGSNSFDFNYRVPINPMNGTLQLRYAPSDSKIIRSEFSDRFDITSDRELYEISFRQPLVRKLREEFALSLGFALQDGQTFLDGLPAPDLAIGSDENANTKTRVLKFGQDYIKRDRRGAWALRSQLSLGMDVFDATVNSDSQPDGRFFSWLGQVQRVQRLNQDNLLIAQAELQLSPDNLLSSQQFLIGGGQSLRGYQQNSRAGDNGFRLSLENRTTLQKDELGNPNLQIAPFIDMGAVWNSSENPNDVSGENFLASVGLGLILQPIPNLQMRIDYAEPLIESSTRGENAQDRGLTFSAGYSF